MRQLLRFTSFAAALIAIPGVAVENPPENPTGVCALASGGYLDSMRRPDFSASRTAVQRFYAKQNCGLAWIRNGAPTDQATAMIQLFESAEEKGLDPNDYDGGRWANRVADIGSADMPPASADAAKFDLALTVSAIRYVSDLRFGRFNAGLLHGSFELEPGKTSLAKFVSDLSHTDDAGAAIEAIEPAFPEYRRTELALARYLALLKEGEDPPLPIAGPVEPGGSYPAATRLAQRLQRLGDLPADTAIADDSTAYTREIAQAVIRFQARHGIEPDGKLDKTTLEQLNVPLRMRVRQLEFALERWRWAPRNFRRPPIVINIPEFRLRALNTDYGTDLTMKVIVGKAYGHQTPVFAANLSYVVFHPYWEVPRSIELNELVPKIERDPTLLARNDLQVVTADGKAATPAAVSDETLAQIRSGALRIRQKPGPKNALGPVKFVFPNDYHIYLHGTPQKQLFAKTRRDFSHGCIRVEKPEELAEWVLRGNPGWTPEHIHDAMSGDQTVEVTLAEPIPVLIVYATAVVSEAGEAMFFPDIYGEDAQLEALSTQGYPYPKWRPGATPPDADN